MNILIAYDSYFGNTELVARAIAEACGATALRVNDLDINKVKDTDLFILGSPIRGWQPTEATAAFLVSLQEGDLDGIQATTFDTRVKMFMHGDAMGKMAKQLEGKGARITFKPQAFFVTGTEGPLFEGELEKAKAWGEEIAKGK